MVSVKYSEAAVEVLDILKYTREEDVKKIPKKFMEFLEVNKSKTYISNLDHTKEIGDMGLKPETEAILGLIYLKYWADEEEKAKFEEKIKKNEKLYQEDLNEKYNVYKLFKQNEKLNKENKLVKVEHKSFWKRIVDNIKKIFRR